MQRCQKGQQPGRKGQPRLAQTVQRSRCVAPICCLSFVHVATIPVYLFAVCLRLPLLIWSSVPPACFILLVALPSACLRASLPTLPPTLAIRNALAVHATAGAHFTC